MNKSIFVTLLSISAIISPANLRAQSSFDDIVNNIISNNPALKSARMQLEAELLQEKSSLNLADPEIEFSHKWGQGNAAPKTEFGVTQSFDWPGVYRHRSESVRHKETASEKLLKATIADNRLQIKLALIDIVYQNRQINLLSSRLATIDTLLAKYSRPENATDLTRLDINKLKIERYRLNSKLTDVRIQKNGMIQSLKAMNGNNECPDANSLATFPDETILSAAEYEAILADDPTLRASEAESKALASQIKAEKAMRLPGLSLGYRYAREEHTSFNGFSVGLTLPFFSTRNKVASATMLQQAQEWTNQQMRIENTTKTYAMLLEVQTLKNEVYSAEKLLAETDYNRLLSMALNGGQISLTDYLIENNYYLQFEEDYLDACYRYQCAAARLNKYVNKNY